MSFQFLKPNKITLTILAAVIFNLVCYINVGMSLATVPLFVQQKLGYNSIIAGMAVSLAYIATFISRPNAGKWMDTKGAKSSVIIGLIISGSAGIFLLGASLTYTTPLLSLCILILGRFCTGSSESWTGTGTNVWNMGRVGVENATHVISWNGVSTYGGMALGAPLGAFLSKLPGVWGGLTSVAILNSIMAFISVVIVSTYPSVAPHPSKTRLPFLQVFSRVIPAGSCLGLATIGFGSIQTFITLYFVYYHWSGSTYALSIFGFTFVMTRFLFKNSIHKLGGYVVSIISLLVEATGLYIVASAHSAIGSYIGAGLTGCGFSLLYPALGIIALSKVGPENRGSALASFSLFVDIALFIAGPLLGTIETHCGYFWLFFFAGTSTLVSAMLTYILYYQSKDTSKLTT